MLVLAHPAPAPGRDSAAKKHGGDGGDGEEAGDTGGNASGGVGFVAPSDTKQPVSITAGELLYTITHAGAGKAAGLDGGRIEQIWMAIGTSASATAAEDEARADGAPPLFVKHA